MKLMPAFLRKSSQATAAPWVAAGPAEPSFAAITSDAAYRTALATIETLWGAARGTPGGDRLEMLALLVFDYEERLMPMAPPDAVSVLEQRLDEGALDEATLAALVGGQDPLRAILERRIELDLDSIRRLRDALGLSAEVLLKPTARAS